MSLLRGKPFTSSLFAIVLTCGIAQAEDAILGSTQAPNASVQQGAQNSGQPKAERIQHTVALHEDDDGNLQPGEYEVVSTNNSVTRSFCPYTCEMRDIPKQSCKMWSSVREPNKCYVQDTRIPSEAIQFQ